ncbi:MAG TPA: hypothetical protein VFO10_30735 [Oligoflexus sp.]|uniref:hypothetical protein n=1 Tax=Oligoflexus sp. TaxID=1971216 RepID=UPI002D7EF9AF|nr:hypothetical protein [Oligoflexus sp.]HET9241684.1 hypothetical protein [Oligoflexus sp.]
MRPALSGVVASCIVLGSPSCGSWSGNPPSSKVQTGTIAPPEKQGTVEIVLQGSGASLRLLDKSLAVTDKNGKPAGQVTLSSARIVLSDIVVRSDRSDATARPSLAGPFVLDLMNNSMSPQPDKLTLPEGTYKDIALNLYQKAGGSVQLIGTYVNATQKTSTLKITLDAADQLSLMNDSSLIQVSSGTNQQIAVTFKLDQWFNFTGKDADLSNATGQDIIIEGGMTGETRKLRDAFLGNVKAAASFDKFTAAPAAGKEEKKKTGDSHEEGDGDSDGNGGR